MPVPTRSRRLPRKLMVTGCARSGTLYVTKALRELGLRVGHEYVDDDGTVSHFFASGNIKYPLIRSKEPKGRCAHVGQHPRMYAFERVIHLTRHPLQVIDSLQWTAVANDILVAAGVPLVDYRNTITRAVRYWYGWNKLCEKLTSERVSIESIDANPSLLCAWAGVPVSDGWAPRAPKDTHHARRWQTPFVQTTPDAATGKRALVSATVWRKFVRSRSPLTWADVLTADPEYAPRVRQLAEAYGYKIEG